MKKKRTEAKIAARENRSNKKITPAPHPQKFFEKTKARGTLVIIGGHEDKAGTKDVLSVVAERVGAGPLVIATVASEVADKIWPEYKKVFTALGVKEIRHLNVNDRAQASLVASAKCLEGAEGVFFTGGDQQKIASELGGTKICEMIRELYQNGGVIAGTSAGASIMSSAMITSGPSDKSVRAKGDVSLAPGLDFLMDIIIDQHFSERGRISRLLGAISLNPRFLGIGIDEDTAIVVDKPTRFKVFGSGSVYILDAQNSRRVNVSEAYEDPEANLSIHDVRLFVLHEGEAFDILKREPVEWKGAASKTHKVA